MLTRSSAVAIEGCPYRLRPKGSVWLPVKNKKRFSSGDYNTFINAMLALLLNATINVMIRYGAHGY